MGNRFMPLPEPAEEPGTWLLEDDLLQDDLLQDDLFMSLDDTVATLLPDNPTYETQLALDALFDAGFTWEEGLRLLAMRDHYYEHPEVKERVAEDPHFIFARWLVEHGVFSEA